METFTYKCSVAISYLSVIGKEQRGKLNVIGLSVGQLHQESVSVSLHFSGNHWPILLKRAGGRGPDKGKTKAFPVKLW